MVVIRNQNILEEDEQGVWAKIFQQGVARLTETGIMVVKSQNEHARAVDALHVLGCEFLVDKPNRFATPTGTYEDDSFDRNIVIVRRKKIK
jgi:hypothetical protein